jgi:hypothetical protein
MSNTQLTQEQALGVLIQAVKIGQSKGAYTLEDAKTIAEAVSVFVPKQPEGKTETVQGNSPSPVENHEPVEGC